MFDQFSEYRALSITCLMQVLLIVIGWSLTCFQLKMMGYPDDHSRFVWMRDAVWMRQWGLILLLIPLLWSAAGIYLQHSLTENVGKWTIFSVGLSLTIGLALYLGHTAIFVGYARIRLLEE